MSEPEPSRPGSILRAEREALGVTVREVSETLNLSIAVIEAIEADDHARLPGPVFARGYVRAYARLLELEPEPLVAQYPRPPDSPTAPRGGAEPPIWEWIRRRPALVLGAAGGLLVVLLVLLVVWMWSGGEPEAPEAGAGAQAQSAEDPRYEAFVADDDRSAAAADAAAVVAQWQAAGEPTRVADGPGAAAVRPGTTAEAGHEYRITPTGDDRLAFAFTDDCWVEVRSAGGGDLYSNLGRGGTELVLVGQGPFRILLGYAPGAQLTFNGEPMPLAPHTRNNVATLVLGQLP